MKRAVTAGLSQPNVHLVTEDVLEWLSHQASTSQMIADVVLVDVPPETDELISPIVQTKLRAILSDESVLVVACGSAPPIADAYELDARHSFLQHVSALPELGGLDYYNVFVYDEVRCMKMSTSVCSLVVSFDCSCLIVVGILSRLLVLWRRRFLPCFLTIPKR